MYPDRDTFEQTPLGIHHSTWSKHGGKWREEDGKNTASVFFFLFFFREWAQHKHKASSWKGTIFKIIPEEKQQLVEEKHADSIRKVFCKSFIQWFWELNLCCYKYRGDCFDSLRLFLLLLKWKSRKITKHLTSGPSGNQLVLFSLESRCFLRLRLGKQN